MQRLPFVELGIDAPTIVRARKITKEKERLDHVPQLVVEELRLSPFPTMNGRERV